MGSSCKHFTSATLLSPVSHYRQEGQKLSAALGMKNPAKWLGIEYVLKALPLLPHPKTKLGRRAEGVP